MPTEQVWTLEHDGRSHRVEASGSGAHRVCWYVDGEPVAEQRSWEEKATLTPGPDASDLGRVVVRFSTLGKPRRATLHGAGEDAQSLAGLGGIDLVPEDGSSAAAYEERVRLHPTRYAVIATAAGVAKVVVPLLLGLLAVRFAVTLPFPRLPGLPDLPDLPRIPWPDLPFPDIGPPELSLPGWLRWLLDKAKYVWPIVLAYVLARAEIRRRRTQDELRRGGDEGQESGDGAMLDR